MCPLLLRSESIMGMMSQCTGIRRAVPASLNTFGVIWHSYRERCSLPWSAEVPVPRSLNHSRFLEKRG